MWPISPLGRGRPTRSPAGIALSGAAGYAGSGRRRVRCWQISQLKWTVSENNGYRCRCRYRCEHAASGEHGGEHTAASRCS